MSGYQFFAVECLAEVVVKKNISVLLQSFPARLIGSENESRIWSNTGSNALIVPLQAFCNQWSLQLVKLTLN